MTEPAGNPNLLRSQRQTLYNLTRRWGVRIKLYRPLENEVDYATGSLDRTYRETVIRNAAYIPPITERQVIYTPAMMQAIREYAWQGSGQDVEETGFLIMKRDLEANTPVCLCSRVRYNGKTYEISKFQELEAGWIVWAKTARNESSVDDNLVIVEEGVGYWSIGNTFEVS